MPRTRLYRNGVLEAEGFPIADISGLIADEACVVWFDLCRPTAEDLQAIGDELGLHALAVEDATNEHERPKLDRYDTHLFTKAYSVQLDVASGQLVTGEVSAFITANALVTVRTDERFDIEAVVKRWDESPDLAKYGVSYLLHGLLDHVVDTHFDAVRSLDGQIEALQDELFEEKARDGEVQRRTFELRKSLVLLRRIVLPMRELVNSLLRRDLHIIDPAMQPYFQDVYDHVLRATEWTESLRDLVTTILETRLTIRSNRLNVITKQVTSWAAIIAVPTAITGFYGQNVPYPGYGHATGFWTSTAVTLTLSLTLYAIFRRKGWL
ncbi:magnesium transporter CorA family protein [Amorphoplanes digitatis]|uniref:Magnesium transporter n=1 Tax=Actinoplanes digitatis TaxID=1868 RepID=A0A7W7MS71_9ACTN|nr:magnesium transporter CorA family protein [Actinoplanes digitatis]MBB4765036.1 magnesium transporter [Actinoplanes digitatis]BFE74736.1 magnesium transporter CorA family protein [Actinoplanes digitatis]GID98221.1 magnesium transporter CorA [Actinoplanes digitatis]